jgi:hypothetical protein
MKRHGRFPSVFEIRLEKDGHNAPLVMLVASTAFPTKNMLATIAFCAGAIRLPLIDINSACRESRNLAGRGLVSSWGPSSAPPTSWVHCKAGILSFVPLGFGRCALRPN